jgi:hypothetical protein
MPTESTERRRQPRTNLSQVVRIRRFDGINVYVTSDFRPNSSINYAMAGVVVRVEKLEDENGVWQSISFHHRRQRSSKR